MDMQLDVVLGLVGINVVLLMLLLWRSISKPSHDDTTGIQKYLDEKLERLERALRLGYVSTEPNSATQPDAKVSGGHSAPTIAAVTKKQ